MNKTGAANVGLCVLLLAAAWWWRRQAAPGLAADGFETGNTAPANDQAPTMMESIEASALSAVATISGTDAASMTTSTAGLAHLQSFERLSLTPYRLGDGGATIGWGRFYPDNGPQPPASITRDQADEWFAIDVDQRAEKWVRAYVTAPLTQPQFDALVSMAYNLSPRSFRTIADAVNAGQDPEAAALQYVRAGSNLERGLRRRRAAELAMFRADPNNYG